MTNYRRAKISGGTYFFTVNLADRTRTTLVDQIDLLKQTVREEMNAHPFEVKAMVVLPEHLHAIWTLPIGDADFSGRWQRIKARLSETLPQGESRSASRQSKGERGIWQRRFWEHMIRNDLDLERHVDYVHFNPFKHGLVQRVGDWPHSTFHRYVREGTYQNGWAGEKVIDIDAGEID